MADAAHLQRLHRELTESGKAIEAGWIMLRLKVIPLDTSKIQLDEMRKAYFAGAQHLFACIMQSLDPGEEPTEADFRRIDLIDAELKAFTRSLLAALETKGTVQ